MKYSYTALTRDNKKIVGVLDSESQDAARSELHKMGVAVIMIGEISDEEYEKLRIEQETQKVEKGIRTFTFLAKDSNNKEVEGTIDSMDAYSAYKRLRTEYSLKVTNIYLTGAAEAEIEKAKTGLVDFETQLEQDLERQTKEKDDGDEGMGKIDRELVTEIDNVIINAKKILESHSDLFSMELLQEIKKTLGTLELIRTSTNIKHITEVSNVLYELVSNPDKIEGEIDDKDFQSTIGLLEDSALVKKESELYKKAIALTGVKKVFKNIADRLKALTETKDEIGKPPTAFTRLKSKFHDLLVKTTKKKLKKPVIRKEKKPKTAFVIFFEKLFAYISAPSAVLKKTRKKELVKAFRAFFKKEKAPEAKAEVAAAEAKEGVVPAKAKEEAPEEKPLAEAKKKRDFTYLFAEIDSFIGWLLCFYIIYFFLVDFSLEKNIGLSRDFIFRTLKTPFILNITVFLLIIHFALRIRNLHFRHNFFAALFLIFLSLGIYTLLIVNF